MIVQVGSTTHNSSFFVASNTSFNIQAYHAPAVVTGGLTGLDADGNEEELTADNITWDMSVETNDDGSSNGIRFGENAGGDLISQDPTGGAAGVQSFASVGDLSSDEAAPSTVFLGGQRTAAAVGSLVEQSVRFDLSYQLDTDLSEAGSQGFDLSSGVGTISSDVTYTVFVL